MSRDLSTLYASSEFQRTMYSELYRVCSGNSFAPLRMIIRGDDAADNLALFYLWKGIGAQKQELALMRGVAKSVMTRRMDRVQSMLQQACLSEESVVNSVRSGVLPSQSALEDNYLMGA